MHSFELLKGVEVIYPSGVSAEHGNIVSLGYVKEQPEVTWTADDNALYTLLFVSSAAPHTISQDDYPLMGYWLVVNIPGNRIAEGQTIVEYRGPIFSDHCHFFFLVFKQTNEHVHRGFYIMDSTEKRVHIVCSISSLMEGRFEVKSHHDCMSFDLGNPIAGKNFQVREYFDDPDDYDYDRGYDHYHDHDFGINNSFDNVVYMKRLGTFLHYGSHDTEPVSCIDVVPSAEADVIYPSGVSANLGNELTPTQVKDQPEVTWTADDKALYTLLFVDPEATHIMSFHDYRNNTEMGQWLVINIPGNRVAEGKCFVKYRGPPRDRGLHRYVFLVFKQTNRLDGSGFLRRCFAEKRIVCSTATLIEGKFEIEISEDVATFNLGYPIAGNYYHAQYDGNYDDRLRALLDLLPGPKAEVIYPSGVSAHYGNELTTTQVKEQPEVTWTADDNALYTLLFVDPEATQIMSYRGYQKYPEKAHWLVVNIPGNRIAEGQTIVEYRGSPRIRGLHRYVFLVFKQTDGLFGNGLSSLSQARIRCGIAVLNEGKFIVEIYEDYESLILGYPIAGNYYHAQYDENDEILMEPDRLQDLLDLLLGAEAEVIYPSGVSAHYGNELTPTQVKEQPEVTWTADDYAFYTLMFVDPEATQIMSYWEYRKYPKMGQWLVVNIPGNRVAEGQTIIRYTGPGPRRINGLRSYIFLVFKQYHKKEFYGRKRKNLKDAHIVCSMASLKWGTFEVKKLRGSMEFNLGLPIAGNYFQAQYDEYVDLLTKKLGYTSFSNYYDGYKKIETKL